MHRTTGAGTFSLTFANTRMISTSRSESVAASFRRWPVIVRVPHPPRPGASASYRPFSGPKRENLKIFGCKKSWEASQPHSCRDFNTSRPRICRPNATERPVLSFLFRIFSSFFVFLTLGWKSRNLEWFILIWNGLGGIREFALIYLSASTSSIAHNLSTSLALR